MFRVKLVNLKEKILAILAGTAAILVIAIDKTILWTFFTYNINEPIPNPMTGETENPGTYVAINVENNVNRSVHDKGKTSETKFTFKSNNPQDYNNLVADGKLTRDEVDEFMKRVDVSVSEISSLYDANEDGELTPETLKHNALTGGDDKWSFRVKPKSGAKGYEDSGEIGNVFTGEHAVEEVDKVVDYVKRGWDKTK